MKRNLLRLVMLFVTTVLTNSAFAQSSTLATLSHEGTISTYYGVTALKEAYNAAVDGDVITLASGSYLAIDLTKAVSICGAGMRLDVTKNIEPTIISGDFKINVPTDNTARFTIEGIYHNGEIRFENCQNAMFLKCRFYKFRSQNQALTLTGHMDNTSFVHCRIAGELYLNKNCSATLINCIVSGIDCTDQNTSNLEIYNSIIKGEGSRIKSSDIRNCIIYETTKSQIPSENTIYNTLVLAGTNVLYYHPNNIYSRLSLEECSLVFKTYTGEDFDKIDNEEFELTDEAKAKYLGTDGTEVGIYGGNLPFDPTPTNPQITKCNVASKSTADGKLSVDIEVKAAE